MKETRKLLAQLKAEGIRKCYHNIMIYNIGYDEGKITSSKVNKKFYLYLINFGEEFLKVQLPYLDTTNCNMLINLIRKSGVISHKQISLPSNYRIQGSKKQRKITRKDAQYYLKSRIQDYEENHKTSIKTAQCVLVNHIKIVTDGNIKVYDSSVVYKCEITDLNGNRMFECEKDGQSAERKYVPSILTHGTPEIERAALEIRKDSKRLLCIDANIVKRVFEIFLESLKAEYIVSQTSFLYHIALGQRIWNPFVSISINCILSPSLIIPAFDDEGNPIYEKMLVQNGLLVDYINSSDYAESSDRAIGCLKYNYETEHFTTGYFSAKIGVTPLSEHCCSDVVVLSAIRNELIYFDVKSGHITFTLDGFSSVSKIPFYYTVSENIIDFINRIIGKTGSSSIIDNMEVCNLLIKS